MNRLKLYQYHRTIIDILVPLGRLLRDLKADPKSHKWPELIWRYLPHTFFIYWIFSLIPRVGTFIYMLGLVPQSAQLYFAKHSITDPKQKAQILLRFFTVILIGFGGVWAFTGHTFLAQSVAESIGWETSPFQIELAFFTLGSAVAALATIWKNSKEAISALVITKSIFWLGAAGVHIYEAAVHQNYAVYNVGPPLIGDILFPIILLGLLRKSYHQPK